MHGYAIYHWGYLWHNGRTMDYCYCPLTGMQPHVDKFGSISEVPILQIHCARHRFGTFAASFKPAVGQTISEAGDAVIHAITSWSPPWRVEIQREKLKKHSSAIFCLIWRNESSSIVPLSQKDLTCKETSNESSWLHIICISHYFL